MSAFNACQFLGDFRRLWDFQVFYFIGFYNEGAGSYVSEDADPHINTSISFLEEALLNTLVAYALSFLDWDKKSNSLINLYRNYPCLIDESLAYFLFFKDKRNDKRNEFFEGLMGDEIFSIYKKIKSHRNQNVAHFARTRQKLDAHKEELNTLIEFVKQKVFDAFSSLNNSDFPLPKKDPNFERLVRRFWTAIRGMKDLRIGIREELISSHGSEIGEKLFNEFFNI